MIGDDANGRLRRLMGAGGGYPIWVRSKIYKYEIARKKIDQQ